MTKIYIFIALFFLFIKIDAQQFNSDNYLAMPHGMATLTITAGTEYHGFQPSMSLFNNWEFFVGAFLFHEEDNNPAKYTTVLWTKYMIYQNEQQNGGLALAGGTGNNPSFFNNNEVVKSLRSWWFSPMMTLPFWKGKVMLDLNPALLYNSDYGIESKKRFGFQYSSRVAVTNVLPSLDLVGEVWGVEGGAKVNPSWRAGLRWNNMPYIGALAASYSRGFDGSNSGGFELGISLYTDQIYCFSGCKKKGK